MSSEQIKAKIATFITNELLDGKAAGLDDETPLLEWGIVDSLGMVALLTFLQTDLGVEIPDGEVLPNNFQNIAALEQLVSRHAHA